MADDTLKDMREAFANTSDFYSTTYKEGREDVEFSRLEKQWPDDMRAQREREKRPCLTLSKLGAIRRQVVNDARQNRPAISVHPVDDNADPETAEVLAGLIRNIEQSSNADVAYDTGIECAIDGGFGYWKVNLDYSHGGLSEDQISTMGVSAFEQDIVIERVANPFAIYGDDNSTAADSSDWMSAFEIEQVKQTEFKKRFKGASETDFESGAWAAEGIGGTWKKESTVQVANWWRRTESMKQVIAVQLDGEADPIIMALDEWEKVASDAAAVGGQAITMPRPVKCYAVKRYLASGLEILEENEWPGSYIPIIPVYGDEINFDGNRYFRSLIHSAKDAQRQFNYWRTAATELVALAPKAPFIAPVGSFETDSEKWETINTVSWSHVEYDNKGVIPQRQPFAGIPAGALQEALNASDDIKAITGIYDASLGARSNETSGKAIMARQREGDVSTFHFIDNQTRAIRHTGKVIVDLIPKVYSTARMIRVLGEDRKEAQAVAINGAQPKAQEGGAKKAMLRVHDLRVGKYDVTVTSGPSYTTMRQEAATQMMEWVSRDPELGKIIGDLLAKNLDWPGADEIARRLEKLVPANLKDDETGQLPPQVMQQLQQMGEAITVLRGELEKEREGKDIDRAKVDIDRYKAETDRMTAVQNAMTPDQVQQIVGQMLVELFAPDELQNGVQQEPDRPDLAA